MPFLRFKLITDIIHGKYDGILNKIMHGLFIRIIHHRRQPALPLGTATVIFVQRMRLKTVISVALDNQRPPQAGCCQQHDHSKRQCTGNGHGLQSTQTAGQQ